MPKGKGELQVKDGLDVRIDPEGWILRETRRSRRRPAGHEVVLQINQNQRSHSANNFLRYSRTRSP